MDKIKSTFLLKEIFSYLDDNKKLEIIKYSKQSQKRMKVNINDYKNISQSYKIGEKNGMGKEYYKNGNLKYKGEYLNGKRNGKGKECYEDGVLQYEGEYLNGKRNGKGKEYNKDRELIYEGEYLNDKKMEKVKISLLMEK